MQIRQHNLRLRLYFMKTKLHFHEQCQSDNTSAVAAIFYENQVTFPSDNTICGCSYTLTKPSYLSISKSCANQTTHLQLKLYFIKTKLPFHLLAVPIRQNICSCSYTLSKPSYLSISKSCANQTTHLQLKLYFIKTKLPFQF